MNGTKINKAEITIIWLIDYISNKLKCIYPDFKDMDKINTIAVTLVDKMPTKTNLNDSAVSILTEEWFVLESQVAIIFSEHPQRYDGKFMQDQIDKIQGIYCNAINEVKKNFIIKIVFITVIITYYF